MALSMKKKCPRCSATLHRMQGKWWCLICRKFVKP